MSSRSSTPDRGDPQRGLISSGIVPGLTASADHLVELPNRGKRSVGIDIKTPEGRAVLDDLIREADVFLTNFLPATVAKLRLDVDDIRAINPSIIYARGTGRECAVRRPRVAATTGRPTSPAGGLRLAHAAGRRDAARAAVGLRRHHGWPDDRRRSRGCALPARGDGSARDRRRLPAQHRHVECRAQCRGLQAPRGRRRPRLRARRPAEPHRPQRVPDQGRSLDRPR
uniref:CoA transferase n=1 Tax=Janibacter limosus TaxID=53458 RepID=A0AC61U5E9_9MICO|nr:CoA transferase [Janibacter limosus]